ncbi:unnamed protein product [Caenorhabditis brenneri]
MRTISIILFLSITGVFLQASTDEDGEKAALKKANLILEKMDIALQTKDLKEFLDMHMANFHFKFCNETGSSVDDLKNILESDPHMSQVIVSKHTVKVPSGSSSVTKVSSNMWKFFYEEHLLLNNNQAFRTEGAIYFIDMGTHVKIDSAEEECPEKLF